MTDESDDRAALAAEAAKYRKKARGLEEQVATLTGHVQALQGAVIESLVEGKLKNPADFQMHAGEMGELLGADGKIDPAKVEAKVDDILTERPYLAPDKATVRTRPRPADGEKAAPSTTKDPRDSLDRAFGARGSGAVGWSDVLNKHGHAAEAATPKDSEARVTVATTDGIGD